MARSGYEVGGYFHKPEKGSLSGVEEVLSAKVAYWFSLCFPVLASAILSLRNMNNMHDKIGPVRLSMVR